MFVGLALSDWKDNHFTCDLQQPDCLWFYIAILYDYNTRSRYLKIGTARQLNKRYNPNSPTGKKYRYSNAHQYTHVRLLAAVQLDRTTAEDFEIQARKVLQQEKGLVYIPLDRFKYFLLPTTIEIPKYEFTFKLYKGEHGEAYKIYGRLDR